MALMALPVPLDHRGQPAVTALLEQTAKTVMQVRPDLRAPLVLPALLALPDFPARTARTVLPALLGPRVAQERPALSGRLGLRGRLVKTEKMGLPAHPELPALTATQGALSTFNLALKLMTGRPTPPKGDP